MTESLPRDDLHTRVVADAFRHFGLRIALGVVLISAAVGGYSDLGPHTYAATSTVLVRPLSGNALSTQTATSNQSITVAMETESSLVTSLAVTQRVNNALDTNLTAGSGDVSSSVPANSQIVQITYRAPTARQAQRRAQAFAQAFLDYRTDLATASQKAQLDRLNAQVTSVQTQLQQALTDAARKTNRPVDADTRVRLSTSTLASLESEIGQVQSASTEPGNVVTPAALPSAPTGFSPALLTLAGALVALIVGAAIAIWRERTDDRIRSGAEVTILGLPVLAVLPDTETHAHLRRGAKPDVPDPIRAEALRRARTSLLAVAPLDSVIAVAGLTAGEPGVTATLDLARTLASAGYRVTMVDAAHPGELRPTQLASGTGLSDVLTGELSERLPLRTVDGVQVLAAGSEPAGASELYTGHRVRTLLRRLQEDADYVLVATAPTDTSEGMAMLLAADGLVLIASDRVSTHAQIAATATATQRLGATVLGLVVRQGRGERPPGVSRRAARRAAAAVADGEAVPASTPPAADERKVGERGMADGAGTPGDPAEAEPAKRSAQTPDSAAPANGQRRSRKRSGNRDPGYVTNQGRGSRPERDN